MTSEVSFSHIVAASLNGVIGNAGALPWHIPEDFKFFKAKTLGSTLIMGRKTFESIGRPLPGRRSIVISKNASFRPTGLPNAPVLVCGSIDEAVALAAKDTGTWGSEVFIIGGGEIYRATLHLVDRVYLTEVQRHIEGDTGYPHLPESEFDVVEERPMNGPEPFKFKTLVRRKGAAIS